MDISIPGRFATSLCVSPPDDKEVLTVPQITNFQTASETSREVSKRPKVRNVLVANLPVRYLEASLPGRFATWTFVIWTFRTFGHFDTRTFRYLSVRFATGRQRSSYGTANYKLSDSERNVLVSGFYPALHNRGGVSKNHGGITHGYTRDLLSYFTT